MIVGELSMNDINLYERIPHEQFPIRMLIYNENGYIFPQHWHEHTEVHYIFKGNGRLKCGEHYFDLQAGDCAIVNGNELHEGKGGKCDYVCLIIPPSFFEQNHSIFEHIVRDERVSDLIMKIYEKYTSHSGIDTLEIKGYMYFLVSHLLRNYSVKTLGETLYSGYVSKLNKINEVIKYIGCNYASQLTTRTLAEYAHLSEGYFCQIFKEVTGKSAMQYINNLRVNKAHKMLTGTHMNISEIAFCCGFDDANYFSRIYKKFKGETPLCTRAREEDKNNNEIG